MTQSVRANRGRGKGLQFIVAASESQIDECIEWPYFRMKNGYGQVSDHQGMHLAHRAVCVLAHGPAPFRKAQAAHSCGNRGCVNPRHLRWASQEENDDDKRRHGTWDSRKSGAKITPDMARLIRSDRAAGRTYEQIAATRGVTKAIVGQVVTGRSWRDA